ncbi:MAG: DUF3307 domain-containing protein [Candidatus Acidiferrales bacterium]
MLSRGFLALYLAHLLSDFVFQTSRLVRRKCEGQVSGYLEHGVVLYASAIVIAGFFVPHVAASLRFYFVVFGLTLVHLLIDFCKINLARAKITGNGARSFLGDQVLHFITVALAAALIVRAPLAELRPVLGALRRVDERVLLLFVVYAGVIFAGGYLIRFLTRPMMGHARAGDSQTQESRSQLNNAGMYIGWLERFLVLTALLLHSPATVGLIIAAKSIARYPEFKDERFAEYFLIGTLLSIGIAIFGGVVLQKVFYGGFALPG